ncbi:MAG: hypothetical protein IJL97_03960 [Lachnospiraceae bacterium]|nr:hypothetical protein [Lachnospiraceae bacterium]
MKVTDRFFVSDAYKGKEKGIGKRLRADEDNKKLEKLYLIVLPALPEDLLDVLSYKAAKRLKKNYDELTVVGAAENREEAMKLAAVITAGVYRETGSFDIKRYFEA